METVSEGLEGATLRSGRGDWFALVAGAVTVVGISITLTTFGAAIGLSVMSSAPTWRESSSWLWVVSGLYLVFVALLAFGLGGYVSSRLRQPARSGLDDAPFRDGLHGVATWGLALVLSAALAGFIALTAKTEIRSNDTSASGAAESVIPAELDQLFRDARRPRDASFAYHRVEAGRILLQASSRRGVPADDRDYLSAVVSAETGIATPEAADRVNRAVAQARDALHRARVAGVLQAFMIAAGLALSAALAWYSAIEGGKERDTGHIPEWLWKRRAQG